jgi:hypothetical protein
MLGCGADHPQLSSNEVMNDYNYNSTTLLCRMADYMENFKFHIGLNQKLSIFSIISVTQNSSLGFSLWRVRESPCSEI